MNHVGQFVDAGRLAARAVDVEDDGPDLGVVEYGLQVGGQLLGAGRPADAGEQVGVAHDRPGDGDQRHAIAQSDGTGEVGAQTVLGGLGVVLGGVGGDHHLLQVLGQGSSRSPLIRSRRSSADSFAALAFALAAIQAITATVPYWLEPARGKDPAREE